jgi:hypothetical protein
MQNIDYDLEYDNAMKKMALGGETPALFKIDTPTGAPSKLTYIQQLLVRTKAFKEWFGDWESFANKIVNERNQKTPNYEVEISLKKIFDEKDESNGNLSKNQKLLLMYFKGFNVKDVSYTIDYDTLEPQAYWHGTKTEEFYEFKTNVRNTGRPYSYFAVNKEYSENFSEGKTLYSVFTCIKNPYVKFDITQNIAEFFLVDIFVDYGLNNGISAVDLKKLFEDSKYNYVKKSIVENFPERNNVPFWMLMARDNDGQLKRFLQELGYDGVMYMEEFVTLPDLTNKQEITRAVTIFEPNQVKLADGRNTEFSSLSNDIRYAQGGSTKMNRYSHLHGMFGQETPKFAEGGSVATAHGITNNGKKGGYFVGRSHAEGGIKAWNSTTNSPIEVEGGEVIITKKAVEDDELNEFEGEMLTNRQILSKINESGGGVKFEDGGEIHQCNCSGKMYKFGGETMEDYQIMNKINSTYNKKQGMKNHKTSYGHNLMRKMKEGGYC